MTSRRRLTSRNRANSRGPSGVATLDPSTDDLRRSARAVQARRRGQPVRVQQVVTDLLARQLAPLVKQGRIKVQAWDVASLAQRVGRLLKGDSDARLFAKMVAPLKEIDALGALRSLRRKVATDEVPVMTSDVLSHDEEDVRDAVQNVCDRDGRGGDPATVDVVAEMMATWLASQPGRVGIAIDTAELSDYAMRIEKILPAVRAESPWRSAIGPVHRVRRVLEMLAGMSATELEVARKERSLLGLRTRDGHIVYPAFQFENGKPIDGLTLVLHAFPDEEALAWDIASWLNAPVIMLDQRSIMDALRAGDVNAAEQAAHAVAERWDT